jgi:hypothetical protein
VAARVASPAEQGIVVTSDMALAFTIIYTERKKKLIFYFLVLYLHEMKM